MSKGIYQAIKYAPIAVFSIGLGGCTLVEPSSKEVRTDAVYGMQLFAENCASCHGDDAKGGGAESLGLGVVPPDLTHFSKENGGTFPRDRVLAIIDGFHRQQQLKTSMPIFGDESLGEIIQVEAGGISTPIPADLLALANYLESIQVE